MSEDLEMIEKWLKWQEGYGGLAPLTDELRVLISELRTALAKTEEA